MNLGCYKLKEINLSPNSDNRILGDNKHSVNDSASASWKGTVDFQKVSGYIANIAGVKKDLAKHLGTLSSTA